MGVGAYDGYRGVAYARFFGKHILIAVMSHISSLTERLLFPFQSLKIHRSDVCGENRVGYDNCNGCDLEHSQLISNAISTGIHTNA
jgi:hypothetical protein